MSEEERMEWSVLGRKIGHASGWDQADTFVMILYDFVPLPGIKLPQGDINFDFENGFAESYDENGIVVEAVDLVGALGGIPR